MKLISLTLKNFRLFKNETFDFKPLTLLTGPNSSGKSSVAKALILLQENIKAPNYLGNLTFNTGNHRLGSYRDVLSKNTDEKNMIFEIEYENPKLNNKPKHKNENEILEGIRNILISCEYAESINSENGRLDSYSIRFKLEGGAFFDFLSMKKNKNDEAYQFSINLEWLIEKLITTKSVPNRPKLYLIWDEINSTHFKAEFELKSEEFRVRRDESIQDAKRRMDTKSKEIKDQVFQLKKEFKDYNREYSNYKEYLDLSEKRKEEQIGYQEDTEKIDNAIDAINLELKFFDDNYNDLLLKNAALDLEQKTATVDKDFIQIKINENDGKLLEIGSSLKKQELERQIDECYKEKEALDLRYSISDKESLSKLEDLASAQTQYDLFEKIDKFENELLVAESEHENEVEKLEEIYYKNLQQLREGNIRSILHAQVGEATKTYFSTLKNIPFVDDNLVLKEFTLSKYLLSRTWGNIVYGILKDKGGLKVVDAINWTDQTVFIRDVLNSSDTGKELLFNSLLEDDDRNVLAELIIDVIDTIVRRFMESLPFEHISAMRGYQQRFYQTTHRDYHIEESMDILLGFQNNKEYKKIDFVNKWVKIFGIGESIEAEIAEGEFIRGFIIDSNNQKMNIADKGLGITELIPIIIFTANLIDTNKMLCIEEPGTHLHPNLQGKLVDFICDAIDNNVQFLIETHSEYFLRNLQFQVFLKKDQLSEKITIKYLDSYLNKNSNIVINNDGDFIDGNENIISSFGEGFFDEGTKWVNKRDFEKDLKIKVHEWVNQNIKIIFCENQNATFFNNLKLDKIEFVPLKDKSDVFFKTLAYKDCFGLIDRDYMTDDEMLKVQKKHTRLIFLKYYCFENYLYHPNNVAEIMGESILSSYYYDLKKNKEKFRHAIQSIIKQSRQAYDIFKPSADVFKNNEFANGHLEIMRDLEVDEFEVYYKAFSMKTYGDDIKNDLNKKNIKPGKLASTIWFKEQIMRILDSSCVFVDT